MNTMKLTTDLYGPPQLYDAQHEERGMKSLRAAFSATSKHRRGNEESLAIRLCKRNLSFLTPWTKRSAKKYNKSRFRKSGSMVSGFDNKQRSPLRLNGNLFNYERAMAALAEKWQVSPQLAVFGASIPAWENAPSTEPIRVGSAAVVHFGDANDPEVHFAKVMAIFSVDFGIPMAMFENEAVVDFMEVIWYVETGEFHYGLPAVTLEKVDVSGDSMSSEHSSSSDSSDEEVYRSDVILADAASHSVLLAESNDMLFVWDQMLYQADRQLEAKAKALAVSAPQSALKSAFWNANRPDADAVEEQVDEQALRNRFREWEDSDAEEEQMDNQEDGFANAGDDDEMQSDEADIHSGDESAVEGSDESEPEIEVT